MHIFVQNFRAFIIVSLGSFSFLQVRAPVNEGGFGTKKAKFPFSLQLGLLDEVTKHRVGNVVSV